MVIFVSHCFLSPFTLFNYSSGIPLDNTVQKYNLGGKYSGAITPMPESQQTLTDASIEVVDGTTTLKFTKLLVEANEIEISTGHNTMLYVMCNGGCVR